MPISRRLIAGLATAAALVVAVVVVTLVNPFDGTAAGPTAPTAIPTPTAPLPSPTVNSQVAPTPPAHGVYFGARVGPTVHTQLGDIAAIDNLQRQIGRRLDIVHVYLKWAAPFPTTSDLAFMQQGSMLLLSWAGTDTQAIASGRYDALIRLRAREIKATGKRIFLEWRWEMDRPNLRSEVHSPADYIAAWDHIRAIFAQEHVDNVAWVWCPTAKGFAGGDAAAFYPGDSEVDWVCSDAYPGPGPYRSFAEVATPFLKWAAQHQKPVMIGEYGVPSTYSPQQRARWLQDAAQTVKQDSQIKALVYFDANHQHAYSLYSGTPALQVFRSMAAEPYFNPHRLPLAGR
jgi:hypothetical protein